MYQSLFVECILSACVNALWVLVLCVSHLCVFVCMCELCGEYLVSCPCVRDCFLIFYLFNFCVTVSVFGWELCTDKSAHVCNSLDNTEVWRLEEDDLHLSWLWSSALARWCWCWPASRPKRQEGTGKLAPSSVSGRDKTEKENWLKTLGFFFLLRTVENYKVDFTIFTNDYSHI